MQRRERAIYTISVQRPQHHNTNLYRKKEEKWKTVDEHAIGSEQRRVIKMHCGPAQIKPASPTPSNMESARSFPKDNERGIKVLQ